MNLFIEKQIEIEAIEELLKFGSGDCLWCVMKSDVNILLIMKAALCSPQTQTNYWKFGYIDENVENIERN